MNPTSNLKEEDSALMFAPSASPASMAFAAAKAARVSLPAVVSGIQSASSNVPSGSCAYFLKNMFYYIGGMVSRQYNLWGPLNQSPLADSCPHPSQCGTRTHRPAQSLSLLLRGQDSCVSCDGVPPNPKRRPTFSWDLLGLTKTYNASNNAVYCY